ncbi:MAG: Gfo/Idh/MocA family oxidoreductase [Ruminococcaceae bacterium]|nr:Gfo/Idh/MocA family oxidoreductase [Oscillospiraceae bacterium]
MLKVAMLSKWHVHAGGYANMIKNSGKAEIVAVWDEVAERGEAWAKELGAEFYADLDALLARDDIQAVICDAPTTAHHDVIIKAAKAGKHVFTEKALCPTVKECLEVKEAIEEAGVTFVISFPQRGRPATQFAKKLIEDGMLGQIVSVRMRDAHAGQFLNWLPDYWYDKNQAAGGAMMDLGCHPMYLLAYFLGKPKRITGLYTAPFGKPVDENAVAIAEFANGAIGVAETSLISRNSPQTLEIYGTEGSFICHDHDVMFSSVKLENKDMQKPENLPAEKPAPVLQFLDCVAEGKPAPEELNIDAAIGLTELLELSYIGDENNTIVVVD